MNIKRTCILLDDLLHVGMYDFNVAIDHFKTESENFGNQMYTRSHGFFFQPITQEELTSELL